MNEEGMETNDETADDPHGEMLRDRRFLKKR